ncbi:MAG TPA: outer membrane protein assembly factor BamD [Burkholderiaceae bacterium]|nr:outer membrane protein assembly factor BamD [Burkholderiaceae bacterium]
MTSTPASRCRQPLTLTLVLSLVLPLMLIGCGSTPTDAETNQSVEKLYAQAKDEAALGNYDKAAKLFEKLEGRAAGTLVGQQAQLERAWALYRGGEKADALTAINRYIKNNPSSPALDYAYYLRGLINFNDNLGFLSNLASQDLSERDQQSSRESYQAFSQLVDRFPDSPYTPDAQMRMNYIVNALASHEVHVARYYFRRGAYVAAASRAQMTVQDFRQSPAVEEALYLMAASYEKLGLTTLQADAERVLKQNFPNSKFIDGGLGRRQSAWWHFW